MAFNENDGPNQDCRNCQDDRDEIDADRNIKRIGVCSFGLVSCFNAAGGGFDLNSVLIFYAENKGDFVDTRFFGKPERTGKSNHLVCVVR